MTTNKTPKQQILEVIEALPDDVTWEDLEHVVSAKIAEIKGTGANSSDHKERVKAQVKKTEKLRQRLKTHDYDVRFVRRGGPGHRSLEIIETKKKSEDE